MVHDDLSKILHTVYGTGTWTTGTGTVLEHLSVLYSCAVSTVPVGHSGIDTVRTGKSGEDRWIPHEDKILHSESYYSSTKWQYWIRNLRDSAECCS